MLASILDALSISCASAERYSSPQCPRLSCSVPSLSRARRARARLALPWASLGGRRRRARQDRGLRGAKTAIGALLAADRDVQTFANTLRPIEDAYGTFVNASNGLTFLQSVSTDKPVRDSSTACNQAVANFGVELSADPRLYAAAVHVQQQSLSPLEKQVVTRYVESGRHGGAALDSATRVRTTALLQRVNDLGATSSSRTGPIRRRSCWPTARRLGCRRPSSPD